MFTMRLITQINRAFVLKHCLAIQTFREIKILTASAWFLA